jgi:hypothetical protein
MRKTSVWAEAEAEAEAEAIKVSGGVGPKGLVPDAGTVDIAWRERITRNSYLQDMAPVAHPQP